MLEDEKPDVLQLYNMAQEEEQGNEDSQDCTFVLMFVGVDMEIFVGLCIAPGFGLVDTGAQHGVVGPHAYRQTEEFLAQ